MKFICLQPSRLLGVLVAAILLSSCGSAPSDIGDGGKGKGKGKGKNAGGGGPVPVEVAKATLKNVPVDITVVGNVEAYSIVSVRAQTGGMLTDVRFKEGDYVKKGDLLFVIDPKPLEGQMNSAKANLAKSAALLKQAQAALARDTASANYARD
ncbi:MAG TPA: biotin/lipoyl-binding protein, partial [Bryobacteraceae bacterium]|nr:biotin/lipoyl-binding protein [Bryobacteraceae bacterium]